MSHTSSLQMERKSFFLEPLAPTHVLLHLSAVSTSYEDKLNAGQLSRALSLTCRHWCGVLRHVGFQQLALHNEADIASFESLTSTPSKVNPTLLDCIQSFHFITLVPAAPWINHCYRIQKIEYCKPVTYSQTLVDDTDSSSRAVHPTPTYGTLCGFPRTLPGSLFPFTTITFYKLHFPTPDDLHKVISQLPNLRVCIAQELIFEQADYRPHRTRGRRPLRRLESVESTNCALSTGISKGGFLDLKLGSTLLIASACPEVDFHVWALIASLLPALSYTGPRRQEATSIHAAGIHLHKQIGCGYCPLTWTAGARLEVIYTKPPSTGSAGAIEALILTIEENGLIASGEGSGDLNDLNWPNFQRLALQLNPAPDVYIYCPQPLAGSFKTARSHVQAESFSHGSYLQEEIKNKVEMQLKELGAVRKLHFADGHTRAPTDLSTDSLSSETSASRDTANFKFDHFERFRLVMEVPQLHVRPVVAYTVQPPMAQPTKPRASRRKVRKPPHSGDGIRSPEHEGIGPGYRLHVQPVRYGAYRAAPEEVAFEDAAIVRRQGLKGPRRGCARVPSLGDADLLHERDREYDTNYARETYSRRVDYPKSHPKTSSAKGLSASRKTLLEGMGELPDSVLSRLGANLRAQARSLLGASSES
ncbi:hypothetical protein PsYK624_117250 [Phanerochaete sordida]|uniref:Uncharacterized protein n=1 Tax=Phanerochaete sordida TaxID=48140 RepID=A0A9P3GL96_9APHY|nr:hypothetical protein PsYK624_117250 [Phanerochaete sordida]